MKGTTRRVPIATLKRRPIRRSDGPDDELAALGRSYLDRPVHPILVRPDLTVADGHRRLRGLELVGETDVEVFVAADDLSDGELTEIALATALHRADLTAYEKWTAASELMCRNPTWQMKDLADRLRLDPSMVTRLLSPSRCTPEWQDALKAGTVGLSDCYAASKLPPAGQAGLLALRLSGASRDAVAHAARRARAPTPEAPKAAKAARVTCKLPSGFTVAVSGRAVSLDDAADALADALKEVKRARELGYTARTFAAAMADRARKGNGPIPTASPDPR